MLHLRIACPSFSVKYIWPDAAILHSEISPLTNMSHSSLVFVSVFFTSSSNCVTVIDSAMRVYRRFRI